MPITTTLPANPTIATFLKRVTLFASLDDDARQQIARDVRQFTYPRGNIIFHQGEIGRVMFIVVSGKVRIFKTTADGHETTTNIFTTGDIFGEFAIFDQLPRSASAKTLTKCDLLQMGDTDYLRAMRALPDLAEATTRLLAAKARWTAMIAEALAQYNATNRLVRILQLYLEQFGHISASGECVLDWGLTQSDLASLLGVRREWLNQILAQWRKRKLLTFEEGVITVPDLMRLSAQAK